jgi:hypothetical protein
MHLRKAIERTTSVRSANEIGSTVSTRRLLGPHTLSQPWWQDSSLPREADHAGRSRQDQRSTKATLATLARRQGAFGIAGATQPRRSEINAPAPAPRPEKRHAGIERAARENKGGKVSHPSGKRRAGIGSLPVGRVAPSQLSDLRYLAAYADGQESPVIADSRILNCPYFTHFPVSHRLYFPCRQGVPVTCRTADHQEG